MKNKFTFYLYLLCTACSTLPALACDICGCGVGAGYIGVLPQFKQRIAGTRYRANYLRSHVGAGGSQTYLTTREKYQTLETWAGFNIGKRVRIIATVPFGINQRTSSGLTQTKAGLADVSATGFYQLFNSRHPAGSQLLVQTLWAGAGCTLPTGRYNPADKNSEGNSANLFQSGTGSTNGLLSLMYDGRLNDAGLNLAASYRANTTNSHGYRYGNKSTVNGQLYHKFSIKKGITIAPNAGLQAEMSNADVDNGYEVSASGGSIWMAVAGVEANTRRWAVGTSVQWPLVQNLARGLVQAGGRGMVHVAWLF